MSDRETLIWNFRAKYPEFGPAVQPVWLCLHCNKEFCYETAMKHFCWGERHELPRTRTSFSPHCTHRHPAMCAGSDFLDSDLSLAMHLPTPKAMDFPF